LGYPGDEAMPQGFIGQLFHGFRKEKVKLSSLEYPKADGIDVPNF